MKPPSCLVDRLQLDSKTERSLRCLMAIDNVVFNLIDGGPRMNFRPLVLQANALSFDKFISVL